MSRPGRPFDKGASGNPDGRPKVPEELKNIPKLNADEVKRIIAKYLRKDVNEIFSIHDDNELFGHLKAFDAIVVSIIKNAIEDPKGDVNRLEFLIQRAGVPLKIEYDDSDEIDQVFDALPADSLLEMVKNSKKDVYAIETGEE